MTALHKSTFNQLVEFLSLDLRQFGEGIHYYCNSSTFAGTYPEEGIVPWDGKDWIPVPFVSSGWQSGGEALVRPSITVPDPNAALYVTLRKIDMAPGAPVNRYLALYGDVVSGNAQAAFSQSRYLLNSAKGDGRTLELELATHLDFQVAKVPAFIMRRTHYPALGSQLQR